MSVHGKMTALADAIREKSGLTVPMGLDAMKQTVQDFHTFIPPATNALDPDEVYRTTRPRDWLPVPVPGDDEVYCLCLIPNGADGVFTANLIFSGSCSVEFGNLVNGFFTAKETITPVTNTRFFHTVKADDYGDMTEEGYRQYLVRITGTFSRMDMHVETYDAYRYGVPYLADIVVGLKTNLFFGSQTVATSCPYLKYVRFVGNGQLKNSDGQNFRGCASLMAVSSGQKAEGNYYSYMFERCYSLLALSPDIFFSNVGYRGAFTLAHLIAVDGLEVMPTNAISMFDNSVGMKRLHGNQINTVNCPDFSRFAYSSYITEIENLNISSMTKTEQMFGLCRLTKLTFAGETTPGGWTIDVSTGIMTHSALVEMIHSLPAATAAATITLTGNPGAVELTDEEIAVATAKNWTVTI